MKTKANKTTGIAPLSVGKVVYIARAGFPGAPIGTRVVVASVMNTGTKRAPVLRFYGNGLWFDAEDVSTETP